MTPHVADATVVDCLHWLEKARHLLLRHVAADPDCMERLEETVQLERFPVWETAQLFTAYRTVNRLLAGLPVKLVLPQVTSSGAPCFEIAGRWPWASIPHLPFSAELGVLWLLIGLLAPSPAHREAARQVGEWHLQLLDCDDRLAKGIFTREEDAALPSWLGPLFRGLSRTLRHEGFAAAAEMQPFHPIDAYFERFGPLPNPFAAPLPASILDPDLSFVGHRSPRSFRLFTLAGGGTGLGEMSHGSLRILSFGPHHEPLEEGKGFGIEGRPISISACSIEGETVRLAGQMRLTGHPEKMLQWRCPAPSAVWVDVAIHSTIEKTDIEMKLLGDLPARCVFYIDADLCQSRDKKLQAGALNRLSGEGSLIFKRGDEHLTLQSQMPFEVIPLAGGAHYFGARFLVSYPLPAEICICV